MKSNVNIENKVTKNKENTPLASDNYETRNIKPTDEDYNPKYDESYLNDLIAKASPKFKDIDADIWLREIRGVD
jgi:hypothetical protein